MKLGKRNSWVTHSKTQNQFEFEFEFLQTLSLSFERILPAIAVADICLYLESFSDDILFIVEHSKQRIMAKTNFHNWFRIANHHLNEYFKLDMSTNKQKKTRIISFFAVLALPKTIRHRKSNAKHLFACTFWMHTHTHTINMQFSA